MMRADFVVTRADGFRLELHLDVPDGTTVALLGPNGAGKSTAVQAIAGLVAIEAGRLEIDGRVVDDPGAGLFIPPEQRGVGVVFQDGLLFPNLTVLDNVCFGLRSRGVPRDDAAGRGRAWLERIGVVELEHRRPDELSGGQARRVALARALVTDPSVLLLDEPFGSLDVRARADLRHAIRSHLDGFAGPRLLVTHDPTEAFLLADEIVVVEDGVVTQHGSAEEIRVGPRTPYAADFAGINLVAGTAVGGTVDVGDHLLTIGDDTVGGPVLATIHPAAISVHTERPGGSPRNVWRTTIERVEHLGSRVRLLTGDPLPLTVEVTDRARQEMGLGRGVAVWVAVKATEIRVEPDAV